MIKDIHQYGLFHVDMMRVVLDLPHKEIADNALLWISKTNRYTTYHDKKINDQWFAQMPGCDKFVDDVYACSQKYLQSTNRKPFEDKDDMHLWAWVSSYREHDQHGAHIHPKSIISGTYYPQAPEGSSPIVFDSPLDRFMMHDTKKDLYKDIKPSTGDMLLWPSWLQHRVHANKKPVQDPRIAISFNVDYARYYK